jgi:hypothetical protein
MPARLIALLATAAVAVGGCGVSDPYQHPAPTRPRATTSTHTTAAASIPGPTAVAVLRRYATLSFDWTSHTLASHQHQLEALATAGARAQAAQTAATYGAGSNLQKSRVANRGQITSIAPGQGPRRGWWVITTQETTTGTGDYQGLPSRTHVYDAQLTHTSGEWQVATWSPQN